MFSDCFDGFMTTAKQCCETTTAMRDWSAKSNLTDTNRNKALLRRREKELI